MGERLRLQAARQNSAGVDLAAYRQAIAKATRTGGFVDYRSAHRYARVVDQVVDSVGALLDGGHASEVVQLTEYALTKLEKAIDSIDDSDGNMGDLPSLPAIGGRPASRAAGAKRTPLRQKMLPSGWLA